MQFCLHMHVPTVKTLVEELTAMLHLFNMAGKRRHGMGQ